MESMATGGGGGGKEGPSVPTHATNDQDFHRCLTLKG